MFILLVRRMNISFLDGEIPGTCTHSEGKTRNIDNFRFGFFITHTDTETSPPNFCSDGEGLDLEWWIQVL